MRAAVFALLAALAGCLAPPPADAPVEALAPLVDATLGFVPFP